MTPFLVWMSCGAFAGVLAVELKHKRVDNGDQCKTVNPMFVNQCGVKSLTVTLCLTLGVGMVHVQVIIVENWYLV